MILTKNLFHVINVYKQLSVFFNLLIVNWPSNKVGQKEKTYKQSDPYLVAPNSLFLNVFQQLSVTGMIFEDHSYL